MRVLVTGGGTGGHIYPALALVKKIKEKEPDSSFLYIGSERGLDRKIVSKQEIPFEAIEIQGFKRKLSLENVKTVYLFFKSMRQAKKLIRVFKPDIVVGTGGYVCGSVVYAAAKLGIPTVIHEQNSVPGITNKFLAKYVDKICVCFKDVMSYFPKEKVVLTGNPRGEEVADTAASDILKEYDLDPVVPAVAIFGGSQGAKKINEAVIEALPELSQKPYQVLYVSGDRYYEDVQQRVREVNTNVKNVSVQSYIDRMPEILANTQLVVSRAGATTIAEITALGIPSILVPSPFVTNDQQTKNAKVLEDNGAAKVIKNDDLTGTVLVASIDEILLSKDRQAKMAQCAKEEGIPDAASRMYTLLKSLI